MAVTAATDSDCDFKGDHNCDDENNNAGCEYDGGDCCGDNVVTTFCSECACKDPGIDTPFIADTCVVTVICLKFGFIP